MKTKKCIEQDRSQKERQDHREPQMVRNGRMYFVISPGSIPLKCQKISKPGRSLHVTEETVTKTVVRDCI